MDKGGECFLLGFSVAVVHSSKENRLALSTVYVVKVHVAKEIKDIYCWPSSSDKVHNQVLVIGIIAL